jgi:hypothetical protein
MTVKASGRAALVLAAGLWICAAVPSQAADDADNAATSVVKHGSSHLKKDAHRKSSADAADSNKNSALQSSQLPSSVINAHAQLTTDTPASKDAKAMSERANNIVQAAPDNTPAAPQQAPDGSVVPSDQLNDVDRALAAPQPAQPEAAAPAEAQQAPPANPPAVVVAASSNNSTWDQTSLIGKIFIGFGALLTVASAARMFIA